MNTIVPSGSLWRRVVDRTRHALRCGALQPIETGMRVVEQQGIPFVVRVATSLRRKDAARAQQSEASRAAGRPVNPFLPYEQDLFVADIPPAHVCLLNKYNVLDHHLLIITRDYVDQEQPLTLPDFMALWVCMAEIDGLGLYNAGKTAGASQPHRHLQLLPLPLAPRGPAVPIECAFDAIKPGAGITASDRLPFRHAFARLDSLRTSSPSTAAEETMRLYALMCEATGIGGGGMAGGPEPRQSVAYNLLITRRWMLLVPRARECCGGISISALNFAGSILVRDATLLKIVEDKTPLAVLCEVGVRP